MTATPRLDPKISRELQINAKVWREYTEKANDARAEMNGWIIKAKLAGHSYRQIREDTGLSIGAIQMVLAKAGMLSE